jgi:hypothetical protein
MPRGDLEILLRSARHLAKLCEQGVAMVAEARESGSEAVFEMARSMHNQPLRTKHALEDELVAWVLDCNRCGRHVHCVPGEGCELGHWAHAEPAPEDHAPRPLG